MDNDSLVSVEWLQARLNSGDTDKLAILDVSWSSGKNMEDDYKGGHIPGAVYFNIMDGQHSDMFPRNVPTEQEFEQKAKAAGINTDTHVVVYSDSDACGFFMSGRAWFTFKLYGHKKVSILDGGWQRWKASGGLVSGDIPEIKTGNFTRPLGTIGDIRRTYEDVMSRDTSKVQVCDSRPQDKVSKGHIKGAQNLPMSKLINPESGTLKKTDVLKEEFKEAGVELTQPLICYCNSGMSSCTLAFAATLCGNEDVSVFHGGFTEWSKRAPEDQIEK